MSAWIEPLLLALIAAIVVPLVVPPLFRWMARALLRCADGLCPEKNDAVPPSQKLSRKRRAMNEKSTS